MAVKILLRRSGSPFIVVVDFAKIRWLERLGNVNQGQIRVWRW